MHNIDPALVTHVYADGGNFASRLHGGSRSEIGAVWAYCYVDKFGNRCIKDSGFIAPDPSIILQEAVNDKPLIVLDTQTNNTAEFYAMLMALENMPTGFAGTVCSDSKITLGRFFKGHKTEGIPTQWVNRMRTALNRLGKNRLHYTHLDGHPDAEQLRLNKGKRNNPVSRHNVWCDAECNRKKHWIIPILVEAGTVNPVYAKWLLKNAENAPDVDEEQPAYELEHMLAAQATDTVIPVFAAGLRFPIAEIRGATLYKQNRQEHFVKVPPAIAIDADAFDMHRDKFDKIVVTNTDTGYSFVTTTTEFMSNRVILDRGHGRQWMVLMQKWNACDATGEALPPPPPPAKSKKKVTEQQPVNMAFDFG